MATSATFKNIVASNIFNTAGKTAIPPVLYLAVSKTAPNASGGNVTEPVGGSYARVPFTSTFTSAPSDGVVKNQAEIQFPESTADWGVVTHWAVFSAAAGGSALMWKEIVNPVDGVTPCPRSTEPGTILRVKPQELTMTILDA
jgi:hypothetical protein